MKLREQFEALTTEKIEAFVANSQEETLHLEFKRTESADLSRGDRRQLAEVLSGFANSDGGIVVWGIDARRDAVGIDRAVKLHPIDPAGRFLSRLNDVTSDAVSPIVDGVEHRAFGSSGSAGYVATLVPRSDSTPHMGKAGHDRYFKRSGTSFVRLEHFDLEDMFGRRPRPRLRMRWTLRRDGDQPQTWGARIVLTLVNEGRGAARAPLVIVEANRDWHLYRYGVDGNGNEPLRRLPTEGPHPLVKWVGGGDFILHAGTELEIGSLACASTLPPRLSARISFAAENAPLELLAIVESTETLLSQVIHD